MPETRKTFGDVSVRPGLYYRRATSAEVMLGAPAWHREMAAGLLKDSAG